MSRVWSSAELAAALLMPVERCFAAAMDDLGLEVIAEAELVDVAATDAVVPAATSSALPPGKVDVAAAARRPENAGKSHDFGPARLDAFSVHTAVAVPKSIATPAAPAQADAAMEGSEGTKPMADFRPSAGARPRLRLRAESRRPMSHARLRVQQTARTVAQAMAGDARIPAPGKHSGGPDVIEPLARRLAPAAISSAAPARQNSGVQTAPRLRLRPRRAASTAAPHAQDEHGRTAAVRDQRAEPAARGDASAATTARGDARAATTARGETSMATAASDESTGAAAGALWLTAAMVSKPTYASSGMTAVPPAIAVDAMASHGPIPASPHEPVTLAAAPAPARLPLSRLSNRSPGVMLVVPKHPSHKPGMQETAPAEANTLAASAHAPASPPGGRHADLHPATDTLHGARVTGQRASKAMHEPAMEPPPTARPLLADRLDTTLERTLIAVLRRAARRHGIDV